MHKYQSQETPYQNSKSQRKTHHKPTSLLLLLIDHLRSIAHIDASRIAVGQSEQSHVQQAEYVGAYVGVRDCRGAH